MEKLKAWIKKHGWATAGIGVGAVLLLYGVIVYLRNRASGGGGSTTAATPTPPTGGTSAVTPEVISGGGSGGGSGNGMIASLQSALSTLTAQEQQIAAQEASDYQSAAQAISNLGAQVNTLQAQGASSSQLSAVLSNLQQSVSDLQGSFGALQARGITPPSPAAIAGPSPYYPPLAIKAGSVTYAATQPPGAPFPVTSGGLVLGSGPAAMAESQAAAIARIESGQEGGPNQ